MECSDVALICSHGGRSLRISAWDISTGAVHKTYSCDAEGGGSCISMLGTDYIACSLKAAPFIYVWSVKKEHVHVKMATVGLVEALAGSPDGTLCIAAIGEKIYVWEIFSGFLLAVVSQHYQPITVVRFTSDGTHFVSGGEDSRVVVWRLGSVLSEAFTSSGRTLRHCPPAPQLRAHDTVTRHVWSDHSLPVTDVYCGSGGLKSRIATASLDQTCKLYELASGQLLCSLLFDFGLTCVALDLAEYRLFAGGSNGKIAHIDLFLQHTSHSQQLVEGGCSEKYCYFNGHSKAIQGLVVSHWGDKLISASEDATAHVWDISSHQSLTTVTLKGPVRSLLLMSQTLSHDDQSAGKSTSLQPFRKHLHHGGTYTGRRVTKGKAEEAVPIRLQGTNPLCDLSTLKHFECGWIWEGSCTQTTNEDSEMEVHRLRQELSEMKNIHRRLYNFAVKEMHSEK